MNTMTVDGFHAIAAQAEGKSINLLAQEALHLHVG